jgi:hypothetical protein
MGSNLPVLISRDGLQYAMSLPSGSVMSESSHQHLLAALEQSLPNDALKEVPLSVLHAGSANSSWIHGPNAGLYRISAVLPQGTSKWAPGSTPVRRRPSLSPMTGTEFSHYLLLDDRLTINVKFSDNLRVKSQSQSSHPPSAVQPAAPSPVAASPSPSSGPALSAAVSSFLRSLPDLSYMLVQTPVLAERE